MRLKLDPLGTFFNKVASSLVKEALSPEFMAGAITRAAESTNPRKAATALTRAGRVLGTLEGRVQKAGATKGISAAAEALEKKVPVSEAVQAIRSRTHVGGPSHLSATRIIPHSQVGKTHSLSSPTGTPNSLTGIRNLTIGGRGTEVFKPEGSNLTKNIKRPMPSSHLPPPPKPILKRASIDFEELLAERLCNRLF